MKHDIVCFSVPKIVLYYFFFLIFLFLFEFFFCIITLVLVEIHIIYVLVWSGERGGGKQRRVRKETAF